MSFIKNLNWRYATKKFDTSKKISENDLNQVLEAIRLAPTSLGIQQFRVLVIQNEELQQKLKSASYNQNQIDTASAVLVFVARTDLKNIKEEFFSELSSGNSEIRASLSGYENMVDANISSLNEFFALKYSSEQAHIALGFALSALAELQIDSCAIGGFIPSEYQKILNLSENEIPTVVLSIGYRAETENPRPKFRLPKEKIFKFLK